MGRNCIRRRIEFAPAIKGLRPFGCPSGKRQEIVLAIDEYEAIRLLDYLHMNQDEAAIRMQISRPTLTRIYERARTKFAKALVEGCHLFIDGGDIEVTNREQNCSHCQKRFLADSESSHTCPKCHARSALHPPTNPEKPCRKKHRCH